MDKFLQRGRILDFQDADTKAFNHYLTALRSGFLFVRISVLRGSTRVWKQYHYPICYTRVSSTKTQSIVSAILL